MPDKIRIEGLPEFRRGLRDLGAEFPKQLRVLFNDAADVIISYAQPRVERRSGRAAASMKKRSTQTGVAIAVGGRAAPYYPWLDFGGAVGRNKSVKRPFYREGRYLYVGLRVKRPEIQEVIERGIVDLARRAGVEVDSG